MLGLFGLGPLELLILGIPILGALVILVALGYLSTGKNPRRPDDRRDRD
jgi:hypothetical protein